MKTVVTEHVAAELNGEFWGVQDADYGHGGYTIQGFGPIEKASLSDPKRCRKPGDLVAQSQTDLVEQLRPARLVRVRVTKTWEVLP